MEDDAQFARGLGSCLGYNPPLLTEQLQKEVLDLVDKSDGFATGLGTDLVRSSQYLPADLQRRIALLAQKDHALAYLQSKVSESCYCATY